MKSDRPGGKDGAMTHDAMRELEQLVTGFVGYQRLVTEAVEQAQDETYTGTALNGGVTAIVTGFGTLRSIDISTLTKRSTDNYTLGDAVVEAVQAAEAAAKAGLRQRVHDRLRPDLGELV